MSRTKVKNKPYHLILTHLKFLFQVFTQTRIPRRTRVVKSDAPDCLPKHVIPVLPSVKCVLMLKALEIRRPDTQKDKKNNNNLSLKIAIQ